MSGIKKLEFNLDGMQPEDLDEIGATFSLLSHYARHKALAMRLRASGDIQVAQIHENRCERIHQKLLPQWAKW